MIRIGYIHVFYPDIRCIIDKINDKELIEDLKGRKSVLDVYVSEEQFQKLFDKSNK